LALCGVTAIWSSSTARLTTTATSARASVLGLTAPVSQSTSGSAHKHSNGGRRQRTFKQSQRSTYAELPHSPAGAIAPRTNRGELVRRAGAKPRAPACGGIISEPGDAPQRDANGNLILPIQQAHSDPRWIGTGRTVLNNKGAPLKQYEPYFSSTHQYETEPELTDTGVTPVLTYDSLGRLVRTDLPNGSYSRVDRSPWQLTTHDPNDTVTEPGNLWRAARQPGASPTPSAAEQRARQLAEAHAETPTDLHLDPLGRPFLAVSKLTPTTLLETRSKLDIQGRTLEIKDPLGRTCQTYAYSLTGRLLRETNIDKGTRWNFQAIDGAPLRRWDDRDQIFRTQHDALRRPTHQYLKIGAAPETLLQRTLYGESHPTPEPNNLRGRPIRHYDEAGALKSESYDFKGNPLETQRRLALAFTAATDWTPLATATTPSAIDAAAAALLETETFTQTRSYDALNRIASATEPDLTEIKPRYNQRGLLDQVEARIRNAATWTTFVGDIQYDAKAQRQSIDYGNGTATAYEYDELTYRLLHLTTTRTAPSNTLQDLSYTFDPVGNIVAISDAAQQTLFYNNSVVLPQNLFEYDALYRLLSATGREHASIGDVQLDHNDLPLQNLPHNNDASAVRTYLEEYQYDAVGNILEMFHEAAGTPVATWTRAYTYAVGTNRLATNTIPGGTATYTHDAHGNLSSMPHLASIEWTPFDQIRTCDLGGGGDVYFTYASDGQRVRKVWQQTASAVKERIYLGAYEIYREKLSGVTQLERQTLHVMAGVQRIAMVETKTIEGGAPIATPVPKHRFQLGNHLGSAMLEVDETGLIISYEEYLPYGNSAYRSARSGVEVSARRYRYTGKERDEETGLYYHGARYYACWIARWTSADPLGLQAGLNLYLYGRASPVVYVDPSGMFDVMAMANLGQTAATNAAISAADAEARSWAPDSSDSLNAETARPSTEYDPNAAAVAMAEPPPRSAPTEFTEPGNMGFGTNLVSPGDLYEQAQLDAGNAWRQEVIERQDYSERDIRGHKLWTQNAQTGKMELTPDRYLELPVGTSDVEVQLALGGAAKALGAVLSRLSAGSAVVEAGTARVASSDASSGGLPMAPKSWQDFLPEAQKRLQATKQRLGNPSGDIVAMAMPRKKALERIESLAPQVEKHLEKIANQPGSRDVPHWRTEIQAWLKSMEEAAPHTGKKTSAEVAERIAEWKRRLGD
jgi:RHS repeat-associated protein